MKIELKKASLNDGRDVYEFLKGIGNGEKWFAHVPPENFEDFKEKIGEYVKESDGIDLKPGRVPQTKYWFFVEDKPAGILNIRHYLNDYLFKAGGHIGYYIHPDYRGRGYGKFILKAGLKLIKEIGVYEVLVTCDTDNIRSRRVIESNGGIFADSYEGKNRFWIKQTKEYMGGLDFWDKKFLNRDNLLEPDNLLVEKINFLKKGSVLDLACGDGRNSIYLSKQGFEVTGVDFSEEALKRLEKFSNKENQNVKIMRLDLTKNDSLKKLKKYDNIVVNHYKLEQEQLSYIHNNLTENGILYICGFGEKTINSNGIRKSDLLKSSDMDNLLDSFELLNFEERYNNSEQIIQYILRVK